MADTFPTLMQLLPQSLQDQALLLIANKVSALARLDATIAKLQALLAEAQLNDDLYEATRDAAKTALETEIGVWLAELDIANPTRTPHYVVYGAGYAPVGGLGGDPYDWEIWDTGVPLPGVPDQLLFTGAMVQATPSLRQIIADNASRWLVMNNARENIFYGSLQRITSLGVAIAQQQADKVNITATTDVFDSVYP